MPTYDYKCGDCGVVLEVFQNMSDEPLSVCRQCGGPLKRLLGTGAGIIFKGSGFYETDYRKKDGRQHCSTETKSGGNGNGSGGKTEKSTEAKSADDGKKVTAAD